MSPHNTSSQYGALTDPALGTAEVTEAGSLSRLGTLQETLQGTLRSKPQLSHRGTSGQTSAVPQNHRRNADPIPDTCALMQTGKSQPIIAVLAVQGAFIEHERKLENLGAHCIELRCAEDLEQPFDALVLPGGESTVQGKLIRELSMEEPLRQLIQDGMPVLATCAGMILLAESIESEDTQWLSTIPMTVRRNAYGRQLGSFHHEGEITGLSPEPFTAPFTFIRAPFVTEVGPRVEVLATVDDVIVAVRFGNQIALAFHPELDASDQIHQAFLSLVRERR